MQHQPRGQRNSLASFCLQTSPLLISDRLEFLTRDRMKSLHTKGAGAKRAKNEIVHTLMRRDSGSRLIGTPDFCASESR